MAAPMIASEFWSAVLPLAPNGAWIAKVHQIADEAQMRRHFAEYNTGSISEDEAYALLALAEYIRARVVIEVGTFIGTSTLAMAASSTVAAVYTCDSSNDCLRSTGVVRAYPKRSSTEMLRDLLDTYPVRGSMGSDVLADLCFFDGVLSPIDAELLARVTHERTVYAFHDYNYGPKIRHSKGGKEYLETMPRKGVGNVHLLAPRLPRHVLVEPRDGTTLALLVPETLL